MKTTSVTSPIIKWTTLGLVLLAIFGLTLMKPPEAIMKMLEGVSGDVRGYSIFIHFLFLVVVTLGLLVKKSRNTLFFLIIAFLSLSASIISIKYAIVPNIIAFTMFFGLILYAYYTKNLNFFTENIAPVNLLFGILGLVFGFWYLHWIESPIWLNALLYSPLGAVNCPTMVTICGFLCLSQEPRSALLETAVGLTTLYFGFFGVFRLGAYVDVVLIICASYLLVRRSLSLLHLGPFPCSRSTN